jgi:hypothetical protein
MSTTAGEGGILTIRDVAGHLKVTERTSYRLAAAKQIRVQDRRQLAVLSPRR